MSEDWNKREGNYQHGMDGQGRMEKKIQIKLDAQKGVKTWILCT